jgi:8-amino-3,8-dideoxy-alpha-D-manno-octulosonate transaminase
MAGLSGISFRHLPDPAGDSATFLSFMLPTEEKTRQAARALAQNQVPCPYWYDNNWHYFRKWDHLKKMTSAAPLAAQLCPNLPDYSKVHLPESDAVMKRTLSMQIMLSWTDQELDRRVTAIETALKNI